MAIHITIYGSDDPRERLLPRRPTIISESLSEYRRRKHREGLARIKRITDAGGIAGLSIPDGCY